MTDRHGQTEWRRLAGGPMSRRHLLRLGALGLTLPGWLALRTQAQAAAIGRARRGVGGGFGRARSCIVLFAWGGMSHLDTWDLKPEAGSDVRGLFNPIRTSAPGVQLCQHMPHLARQAHRMAIVRSVHHNAPSHRSAAYWNLTGHAPLLPSGNWERSRKDWPSIGSMVAKAHAAGAITPRSSAALAPPQQAGPLPGSVCLPYPIYDGGWANGQHGGFLGLGYDPVIVRPRQGRMYEGKSPEAGWINMEPVEGVDRARLTARRALVNGLEGAAADTTPAADAAGTLRFRRQALDLLLTPAVRDAFDVAKEPPAVRQAYGDHICGQSVLMARRLTDVGVPLVTVYCAAGDLNGSAGSHWDTHGDGFNRIKNHMLPPLDQAAAALLDDLASSGRLDQTLVVWLTEFGRTPKINGGAGRDHYPNCYSVAFAGGGIAGGQVYGRSNATGAEPAAEPCGPPDLHATVFHALGIDPAFTVEDLQGRPHRLADGKVLPLFG